MNYNFKLKGMLVHLKKRDPEQPSQIECVEPEQPSQIECVEPEQPSQIECVEEIHVETETVSNILIIENTDRMSKRDIKDVNLVSLIKKDKDRILFYGKLRKNILLT